MGTRVSNHHSTEKQRDKGIDRHVSASFISTTRRLMRSWYYKTPKVIILGKSGHTYAHTRDGVLTMYTSIGRHTHKRYKTDSTAI